MKKLLVVSLAALFSLTVGAQTGVTPGTPNATGAGSGSMDTMNSDTGAGTDVGTESRTDNETLGTGSSSSDAQRMEEDSQRMEADEEMNSDSRSKSETGIDDSETMTTP